MTRRWLAAFSSGHDFHAETASRVFGVAPQAVTGDLRSKIKAMNYGLAYGLSVYGLSQQLHVSADEARAFMDEYFQPVRRGARLSATTSSRRPARMATPRRSWAAAGTCPT